MFNATDFEHPYEHLRRAISTDSGLPEHASIVRSDQAELRAERRPTLRGLAHDLERNS